MTDAQTQAEAQGETQAQPIIVSELNFSFGTGEAKKQVLFDINLNINSGQLTVLMGASGSGKTTLLTLVGCLRRVQEGSVQLLGHELNSAHETQLMTLRRQLGFIFQAHNLHNSLTAMQNVRMGLEVHGKDSNRQFEEAAAHMLGLVGLSDRLHYLPGNLSGGQKQRVAVARALVGNPSVVFADEPTAALDKDSGMQVVDMLKELGAKRGTTTLMVTHDNRILDRADRVITLEDGRITDDQKTK
ncbi:MAG: ATP-binding cassette domain-containing protein [Burkholderiaceae bacterium]